jgi:hypothetical protein
MRHWFTPWIPAAFCAFISLMALFASTGEGEGWWRPAFFAFLPMCFFFVGSAMLGMQRQIGELRQRLAALDRKGSQEAPA